jgi:hypothetical protein
VIRGIAMKLAFTVFFYVLLSQLSMAATQGELIIVDELNKSHTLNSSDLARLARTHAKVSVHGEQADFEGVQLSELLKAASVKFGDALKGKRAATVVVIEAADDYRTALSLLEIDPDTSDKQVIVADRRNGKPLDDKEGPYRLVIPADKRPIRWIRMIRTMRVLNLKDTAMSPQKDHK